MVTPVMSVGLYPAFGLGDAMGEKNGSRTAYILP